MSLSLLIFFFNDTATTEIYTLSLHDALPILSITPSTLSRLALFLKSNTFPPCSVTGYTLIPHQEVFSRQLSRIDRKSTRLNSSHANISYAVFCLKKKKITTRM